MLQTPNYRLNLLDSPGISTWSTVLLPFDTEPGRYKVIIVADAAIVPKAAFMGLGPTGAPLSDGPRVATTLTGTFEALPPGTSSVEVVDQPELRQRFREAVKVSSPARVFQPMRLEAGLMSQGSLRIGMDVDWKGWIAGADESKIEGCWEASLWRADGSQDLVQGANNPVPVRQPCT